MLPRGSELLSAPVGPELAVCRFTTTADVRLNPISLSHMQKTVDTKGKATVTLRFTLEPGAQLKNLALSPLRLYLHAEMPTALMLHEFLTRRVASVRISAGDTAACDVDPKTAVSAGGMSLAESILPQNPARFLRVFAAA